MDFYSSGKCGLSLFSFWFVNFFFPEPKRKRSRAAFSNFWNRNLAMFGSKKNASCSFASHFFEQTERH